ncbi:hypothetical protein DCW30_00185 [Streptomyces alfalfae]|uniref:Regulatory protein n=1 Tax=Streptomyces alfalfae TaxID=1642299 RepID=A0A1P8TF34_9ACTN|nr:DUF6191 domain-containing protein [Streptomyces alfalfae]AYA16598.1 hypothetical protein D3X13_10515 [Streptomyces fradiae]APY86218.1 hypothetical protein A7J05_11305 [Streptomyces alfalfae]QQC91541.1 hypothetical protein I8755_26390 [Streptomyces alfalfae]QUI34023.1 hypothetical protein H9W91_26560 [Streptomyces alfalfae]RXX48311.1 hypothetical protein DCW30_00185 [Streptomyces alfalfae]
MFNAIEALFAPGRKHTDDEQKRLETTRVDLADGDPGRGPIDLSSGKVVVRPPVPAPRADRTDETDGADATEQPPPAA